MPRSAIYRSRRARIRSVSTLAPLLALIAGLGACSTTTNPPPPGPTAIAALQPKSGSQVAGTVAFTRQGDQVKVVANLSGLRPNQEHGFHVHEKGDCSSPDAMSAGGHFNPTAQPHGAQGQPHHGGDMPSLKADANGTAETSFTIAGVALGGGPTDLIGKAVVVHAKPDDYLTQPTGNSGERIACGVIVPASTKVDPLAAPAAKPM
jgi:Cu-Zn family superoxide dismutase